jgi:SAM-dependent methyltransferase
VSFVEYNSLVYICRKEIPRELASIRIEDLPPTRKTELLDRAIERFRGYPRGLLELARGSLLLELGDARLAKRQFAKTRNDYLSEPPVMQALEAMQAAAEAPLDGSTQAGLDRTDSCKPAQAEGVSPSSSASSSGKAESERHAASRSTSVIAPGRAGISEGLRNFIGEFPYERGPIFDFLRSSADRLPVGSDVADVGAGQAPYRELFQHTNYITIDWEHSVHEGAVGSDIIAPAESLPVDDESFDAVILTQVLEHVPEPGRVLQELYRVTRPGGQLFLTAPLVWELHEEPFDYYRFTEHGLRYLLQEAGFDTIEIIARNNALATLAQLMQNVSWMIDDHAGDRDIRVATAEMLRSVAAELAPLGQLDTRRIFPLGYAVVARRL